MSAPETNVPKQAKRHRPSLVGIAVAVLAAAGIVIVVGLLPSDDVNDTELTRTPVASDG